MDQLTGIDTGFLTMESSRTYGHVGLLTIFDPVRPGRPLTTDDIRSAVEERLHLMPPLRRRLAEVPLGIDRPYWFEDPDFDLDFHLRRTGIPSPGTDEQLAELVSRLHARPLDRTRPLWELYVIEGLPGGRTAQYTKIHHAAIDAVTGADLMSALLDTTPDPPPVEPPAVAWSPDRRPAASEMFTRGLMALAAQPGRALRLARPVMQSFARSGAAQIPPLLNTAREVLERVPGVRDLPGLDRLTAPGDSATRPGVTAPRTSFNQRITQHRRFAFTSMDFDDVHRVKDAFDVTVNDVILTICAGALRSWLGDRRELPTDPLIALVPLSVRDGSDAVARDSRVAAVVTVLATNEPDPVRRLSLIAVAAADARSAQDAVPATLLADVSRFTSPGLASLAARVVSSTRIADVANPPFNLVITNVPGAQQPLYCAGARQVAMHAVPVINDGVGLNISAISYDGRVHIGAVACRELMPDLWGLVRRIPDALSELNDRAGAPPRRNRATSTARSRKRVTTKGEPDGRTA